MALAVEPHGPVDDPGWQPWFKELYEHNNRVLYRVLLRRCDPATADDLRQEAFMRAWQHRDSVRPLHERQQRVWLLTTARHLAIDRARRIMPEVSLHAHENELTDMGSQLAQVDDVVDVRRALTRLSVEQRELLAYRYRAKLTCAEIAQVLGISTTAVTTRLARARNAFSMSYHRGGTR